MNEEDIDFDSMTGDVVSEEQINTYEEELSYSDILASLLLSPTNELFVTVPMEEEEKLKSRLKNLKARQVTKAKEDGLPVSDESLEFSSTSSKEFEDCVRVHICLKRRGLVRVMKMEVPDNSL